MSSFAAEAGTPAFGTETGSTVRIDVDGGVWLKPGAVIAHRGGLTFERLPTLGARSAADAVLREAAPLVRATGHGQLYCGQQGGHVRVVQLSGERLIVAWKDLLAFEATLGFDAALLGHGVGIAAGGFVVVALSGHGSLAVLAHGQPLRLQVSPGHPLFTDPYATLAWSAGLEPSLRLDVSWRAAIGHGGQQPVQMHFEGDGFVVVHPERHARWIQSHARPIRKVASLLTK